MLYDGRRKTSTTEGWQKCWERETLMCLKFLFAYLVNNFNGTYTYIIIEVIISEIPIGLVIGIGVMM